jgi:IS30 family transposase
MNNQETIRISKGIELTSEQYFSIIGDTKKGMTANQIADKTGIVYNTITRIKSHARQLGLLEAPESSSRAWKTRRARQKKLKNKEARESKVTNVAKATAPVTVAQTPAPKPNLVPISEKFIRIDFKGTEVFVERTGKVFVTSEGLTVK